MARVNNLMQHPRWGNAMLAGSKMPIVILGLKERIDSAGLLEAGRQMFDGNASESERRWRGSTGGIKASYISYVREY